MERRRRRAPDERPGYVPVERRGHLRDRPARASPNTGRRSSDYDPRTTLTRKVVVFTVVVVQAVYLAGEATIFGPNYCP